MQIGESPPVDPITRAQSAREVSQMKPINGPCTCGRCTQRDKLVFGCRSRYRATLQARLRIRAANAERAKRERGAS